MMQRVMYGMNLAERRNGTVKRVGRRRKPMREEKAKGGESRGREWENLERDSKIEKKRKTNISE